MSEPWSSEEVFETVTDYLRMWRMTQVDQKFSKVEHCRALHKKLNGRTEKAIEYKHQNISAILMEHGWQPIPGYKPKGNYQRLLADVVAEVIMQDRSFDSVAESAVDREAVSPLSIDINRVLVPKPRLTVARERAAPAYLAASPLLKRDYFDREARNHSLGLAGEEFVLMYERARLTQLGKDKLADKVEHTAVEKGDGFGYDIASFDVSGAPRYIEVKTTSGIIETPFFLSRNELAFSKEQSTHFHLYRVFDFRKTPRLYDLQGAVDKHCTLDAITYQASVI